MDNREGNTLDVALRAYLRALREGQERASNVDSPTAYFNWPGSSAKSPNCVCSWPRRLMRSFNLQLLAPSDPTQAKIPCGETPANCETPG